MLHEPRVLVVDDDIDLAEIACEMMGMEGATAIYRTSITDAVEALSRHAGSITVLFTDIRLASPMTGIDLAVYVSQEYPDVAICVTSGIEFDRPRRLPDKAAFLAKPWRRQDLVDFVRAAGVLPEPPASGAS